MKDVRSHCPVNFSLESVGDRWSLLILRDMVCYGKQTYGEFLRSKEKISTRVLAMRLEHLEKSGIIARTPHESDKRKEIFVLTPKGVALIPVLIELATWGANFDAHTNSPPTWLAAIATDLRRTNPTHAARQAHFINPNIDLKLG